MQIPENILEIYGSFYTHVIEQGHDVKEMCPMHWDAKHLNFSHVNNNPLYKEFIEEVRKAFPDLAIDYSCPICMVFDELKDAITSKKLLLNNRSGCPCNHLDCQTAGELLKKALERLGVI